MNLYKTLIFMLQQHNRENHEKIKFLLESRKFSNESEFK